MTDIPVNNKLSAVHEGKNSLLHGMISARTKLTDGSKAVEQNIPSDLSGLWSADWWGLSASKFWSSLSEDKQSKCLAACNGSILNEAYFIEKSGLAYSAKMILLAESTDIGQLYALIGADEARHLSWIEPYLSAEAKVTPQGDFLAFLSNLIENISPNLLTYLVQIILEGWGLDHYKRLADGCQSEALSAALTGILKDEALHHKSGTILFDASQLSAADLLFLEESLQTYCSMVQVGPVTVLSCIRRCAGVLSIEQIEDLLIALKHSEESARKLNLLKNLMTQKGVESIVAELGEQGAFKPLSIHDAAQFFLQLAN